MRVTFLLPQYPTAPIGGFRVVYEHANALARRGHEVAVVHPRTLPRGLVPAVRLSWPDRMREVRQRRRVRRRPLHWQQVDPRVRLAFVRDLAPHRLPDADVLVTTAWQTAELAQALPGRCGAPVSFLQHHETWSGDPARVDATWRLPWPKVVIADWLLQHARDLGVDADVTVVRNAVDSTLYRPIVPPEDRGPTVAMLLGWTAWKGADVGLEALAAARAEVPALSAVLFGHVPRPPDLPAWATYVQDASAEAIVREVYNASAVFLSSSASEGWGLPSTEAMACGCALVTTDNLGSREFAEHGRTALVAPVGDARALAVHVTALLRDPSLRTRLATAGLQRVRGRTWDDAGAELESVLRRAAAR